MIKEIVDGIDLHTDNQNRFGLPSRVIAKVLNFRILYGGNEYSFANDPDFTPISKSEKYWKEVVDAYYEKYKGIGKWHKDTIRQVVNSNGYLISPTGRRYKFNKYNGSYKDTQIKNFSVQGTGADLMAIARISAWHRIKRLGYGDKCLFVNTVHDSIVLDFDERECDSVLIAQTLKEVFVDIPKNFEKLYGKEFNVPMAGEVQVGDNLAEMKTV